MDGQIFSYTKMNKDAAREVFSIEEWTPERVRGIPA
jgi:hypothetical protein